MKFKSCCLVSAPLSKANTPSANSCPNSTMSMHSQSVPMKCIQNTHVCQHFSCKFPARHAGKGSVHCGDVQAQLRVQDVILQRNSHYHQKCTIFTATDTSCTSSLGSLQLPIPDGNINRNRLRLVLAALAAMASLDRYVHSHHSSFPRSSKANATCHRSSS